MKMKNIKNNKGFTLIELLVVVAIIAMLSSLGMALINNAQIKSRDTRRMSDINEIQKALNLYYSSNNNFPIIQTLTIITGTDALSTALENDDYITEVPTDPAYPNLSYSYQSNSKGTDYSVTFCLETDSISNYSKGCGNNIGP